MPVAVEVVGAIVLLGAIVALLYFAFLEPRR